MFRFAANASHASIRHSVSIVTSFFMIVGCGARSPSDRPASSEATRPARVFLEAIVFDAASEGLPTAIEPSSRNFGDIARRAGARRMVSPHAVANNDAVAHLSPLGRKPASSEPVDGIERALATYRLDVTPHVLDDRSVRLQVDLELANKVGETTVLLHDKEPVVLDNGATVAGRRFVVILRPSVIRTDADFRALRGEPAVQ